MESAHSCRRAYRPNCIVRGAEIITVNTTKKAADSISERASGKADKTDKVRKIQNNKKKMISPEARPVKKIPTPASAQNLKKNPVQDTQSFIMKTTAKASGAASSQHISAVVLLYQVHLQGVLLLYSHINAALISDIAFEFSRRHTCRPPPSRA